MSMLIWILLGLTVGMSASKIINTTGEGTVVDILIGVAGAIVGGWLCSLIAGASVTGLNMESAYSISVGIIGAVMLLVIYHVYFRHRML